MDKLSEAITERSLNKEQAAGALERQADSLAVLCCSGLTQVKLRNNWRCTGWRGHPRYMLKDMLL